MRYGTRRRIVLFARLVVAASMVGAAYGGLTGWKAPWGPAMGALTGAIDAFVISSILGAAEVFLSRSALGRSLDQLSFVAAFTVKWLVYGGVITAVQAGDLAVRLLGRRPMHGPLGSPFAPLSLAFAFAVSFGFIFVLQMGVMVGRRTLRNLVLGRYHRPRVEERFFLFVDLVGSTRLAERLGPVHVHRFFRRVFRIASELIEDYRGEVYQYVGDEMVLTWTLAEGRDEARPLAYVFALREALAAVAPRFVRDFGAAPAIRAALHAGEVVAGEVGTSRREIVFHGDVLNTAARIEQLARDLDRAFLASADALARLRGADAYTVTDLGLHEVRGRATPVPIRAVEAGAARPGPLPSGVGRK